MIEQPADDAERPQRRLGVRAADRVDHHVDAAAGQLAGPDLEVLVLVGDGGLGAHGGGVGQLLGGGRGGDHPGAQRAGHVDGGQAHAAAGAEHQDRLAGPRRWCGGSGRTRPCSSSGPAPRRVARSRSSGTG